MAKWSEVYIRGAQTQSASSVMSKFGSSQARHRVLSRVLILGTLGIVVAPLVLGCGPRRDTSDAGGARDFGIADSPPGGVERPVCSDTEELPFVPVPVNLLVLFDRSESMGAAFGE